MNLLKIKWFLLFVSTALVINCKNALAQPSSPEGLNAEQLYQFLQNQIPEAVHNYLNNESVKGERLLDTNIAVIQQFIAMNATNRLLSPNIGIAFGSMLARDLKPETALNALHYMRSKIADSNDFALRQGIDTTILQIYYKEARWKEGLALILERTNEPIPSAFYVSQVEGFVSGAIHNSDQGKDACASFSRFIGDIDRIQDGENTPGALKLQESHFYDQVKDWSNSVRCLNWIEINTKSYFKQNETIVRCYRSGAYFGEDDQIAFLKDLAMAKRALSSNTNQTVDDSLVEGLNANIETYQKNRLLDSQLRVVVDYDKKLHTFFPRQRTSHRALRIVMIIIIVAPLVFVPLLSYKKSKQEAALRVKQP